MNDTQFQNKKIQIMSIEPVFVAQLNKNKWKVRANDGLTYECWDAQWMGMRQIGEWVDIQFGVKTNQGNNGKMYTNYIIYPPRTNVPANNQGQGVTHQPQPGPVEQPSDVEMRIMQRIQQAETNIIEAIRMHMGNNIQVNEENTPDVPFMNPSPNDNIPIIDETPGGSYQTNAPYQGKKNPF